MYPHFLGIGAPRAGTSWLDQNLRRHPRIWMPPVKAVRYFKETSRRPIMTQLVGRSSTHARWRERVPRLLFRPGGHGGWVARFLFRPRTDRWYASLFTPGPDQLAGEITPAYGRLSEATIERIRILMPEVKLIYLLRHPIDRLWSEAALSVEKSGRARDVAAMCRAVRDKENVHRNSAYLDNIERWEACFSSKQLFVGFFDELEQAPVDLLRRLYRFLGLPVSGLDLAHEKRNARTYPDLPRELRAELNERYGPSIERLHRRFDNPFTRSWLESVG
ncbi:MAG: sulfotransferase [Verrucomicrobiota bacterium]